MPPLSSTMTSPVLTEEEVRRSRIRVHPKGHEDPKTQPWRPWPWGLVPDKVASACSLALMLPAAPFMGVLIGTVTGSFEIFRWLHRKLGLQVVNDAVLSAAKAIGPHMLVDARNYPYLPYIFFLTFWCPFLLYWVYTRHTTHGFEWWLFFAYNFLRLGPRYRFFAHVHVLVHKEGHEKRIFKGPFRVLNYINQWLLGPFYGQVPMTYETGHNKVHHRFDGGLDDLHTNLDLDRSKPSSLLIYFPRFWAYWSGFSCIHYFIKNKEWSLAKRMTLGAVVYHAVLVAFTVWDWKFSLAYCIYPYFEATLFFTLISYLWHAWMDPSDPFDEYVNSVTILNGKDNIWNEDYHVVHHSSQCHWSEYPAHYEKHKHEYISHQATIFEKCEEGEMLHWLLSCNWDALAEHFVDLRGKLTHEEKKELILRRLRSTLSMVEDKTE